MGLTVTLLLALINPAGSALSSERRTDDTREPTFYNPLPFLLHQELIHSHRLVMAIRLTIGDGAAAMAALEAGIKLIGICLSETHAEMLYKRLSARGDTLGFFGHTVGSRSGKSMHAFGSHTCV